MKRAEEDFLVLAAQQGNEDAFALLYKHYNKPLLRFAFKISANHAVAQDAVQEAWLKCSNSLKKLKDPRAFKSWIYRAARWRTLEQIRKNPHDNKHSDLDNHPELIQPIDNQLENRNQLQYLLRQLPKIEQQAIYLFYLEEMKISEISIVLELPVGTVKSRLNRARNRLRDLAS